MPTTPQPPRKRWNCSAPRNWKDGQKYFGLYLQQLQQRVKSLTALNEPMIGDGLVKSDTDPTFWMQAMVAKGEKLDMKDLKQQAAMPLSSFMRFDPWTDQVIVLHSAYEPLLTAADKMPFEVEPVYLKLSYYKAPEAAAAAPACRCRLRDAQRPQPLPVDSAAAPAPDNYRRKTSQTAAALSRS